MLQRGRVSRLSRSVVAFPIDVDNARLAPPSWLSRDEKKLFSEIVGSTRARHFTPSDEPLLCSYVQATMLVRRAIKKAGRDRAALVTWERATKIQGTLATKLRLAPQSRLDRKSVSVGLPSMPVGPLRPWEEA
jgi:hypothetical protein